MVIGVVGYKPAHSWEVRSHTMFYINQESMLITSLNTE